MSAWPVVRLGTALELAYGKALPKSSRVDGGTIPVYGSNGIAGWHSEPLVEGPTVIVGRKGSAGAVQYVDGPSFPIDTTYFVRPREGFTFNPKYLFYMLRNLDLSRLKTATGVPGLTREDAYRELIPVPPMDHQRQVVELLSRAEGILQLRREAQNRARPILPALFIAMFGNPTLNPKRWSTKPFGSVGILDRGRSRHRPRDAAELYGGPYPFIQTGDVANSGGHIRRYTATYSETGLQQSRLWSEGTLCITIAANIAKTGILSFKACFPDSVVGFIPGDEVTTAYVQGWLGFLQPTLEASAPQAAQKNINLDILRNLPIPVPPMHLQTLYGRRFDEFRSIERQQEAALSKTEAVFTALLSRAFSSSRDLAPVARPLEAIPA